MFFKITYGYVVQTFSDKGICIAQEFIAGDQVEYENINGEPIDCPESEQYQPFEMKKI